MFRIRYGKIIASCVALAVAALLVTVVLTHTGRAKPRPAPRPPVTPPANEVIREGIKPGNYATAINIHNPSLGGSELNTGGGTPPPPRGTVTFYKKAVIAQYEGAGKLAPSGWHGDSLYPDYAMEIDCTNIWEFLGIGSGTPLTAPFTKGFVVILATAPLDVYGVYTAEPPAVTIPDFSTSSTSQTVLPGIALEMLPIAPRIEYLYPFSAYPVPRGYYYEYSAKFLCGNTQPVND